MVDMPAIGMIEQTKNVKQSALAAAGRADHRMDRACFEIERNPAQSMHALFLFAEVTLEIPSTAREISSVIRLTLAASRPAEAGRALGRNVAGDEDRDHGQKVAQR